MPFTNGTDGFTADGDVACPATGCTTLPGVFGFVGQLDPAHLNVSLLPSDKIYTFDGSATCTGNAVIGANCSGPFALNFFSPTDFPPGNPVVIPNSDTYFDPSLGIVRHLDTRVTLSNVTTPGTLDVTAFSRERGAIPAPYVTSTDGRFQRDLFRRRDGRHLHRCGDLRRGRRRSGRHRGRDAHPREPPRGPALRRQRLRARDDPHRRHLRLPHRELAVAVRAGGEPTDGHDQQHHEHHDHARRPDHDDDHDSRVHHGARLPRSREGAASTAPRGSIPSWARSSTRSSARRRPSSPRPRPSRPRRRSSAGRPRSC